MNHRGYVVCNLFPSAVLECYPCVPSYVYHVSTSNRRDSIVKAYPFVWCSSHPGKTFHPVKALSWLLKHQVKGYVVFAGSFLQMPAIFRETRKIGGRASLGVDYVNEYIHILLTKKINCQMRRNEYSQWRYKSRSPRVVSKE